MSGHAYSRAVRAHVLVHLVLAKLIWESVDLSEDEAVMMENTLNNMDPSVVMNIEENELLKVVSTKFRQALHTLESRGPTAKLWVQYFSMVTLIKQFIEAERMGNWTLHLTTVQKMLPFFHAAGHFFYAKCAHLYFQDMLTLENRMDSAEYHEFKVAGFFTIRRSKKFWSGIWTDQTIEQTLMRMMKTSGGLTTGRGITDGVLTRWTLGMIHLQNICFEIEKFCDVKLTSSEQHVDTGPSRIARDNEDAAKLSQWLSEHNPFPKIDVIMSIDSGIVGGNEVNCHLSEAIGRDMISKMTGKNFENVKFKRKGKVVTLASINSSVKIGNISIVVDPLMLFHRLCIAKQSDDDLKAFFKFELSPFPISLFTGEGMRKGTKSSLYTSFSPITEDVKPEGSQYVVVDCGH
ncbi:hypothetical protein AVEN_161634-1 [Araneus ventricosus]|uniref:Uncharacterized protein n=1 Tax=Araneus ventricosus TaxID=182803 RepID=A0A4Y2WLG0_ARAVE|nr:hypothetical protein AVEN_161634-1 [Araneus ventricosus]